MILIDRACYERGCACFDSRIDEDPVEIVVKREWVGLTDEEELKLAQDSMGKSRHWLVAQVEAKLKEKNT